MLRSFNHLEAVSFKCNSCDKEFKLRLDFLRHRKKEHEHVVPKCRNEPSKSCKFGDLKCWFNHTKSQETYKTKNIEKVIEKDIENLKGVDKLRNENKETGTKLKLHRNYYKMTNSNLSDI